MSKVLSATCLFFAFAAQAEVVTGSVKFFQGRYVESGAPYAYYAVSNGASKIVLPDWIDGSKLPTANQITIDGDLESLACTDMSSACIDAMFTKIKSVNIVTSFLEIPMKSYGTKIKLLSGRAVESPRTYSYYAIVPSRVEVPNFLNPVKLIKAKAKKVEASGVLESVMCTDMSAACGPSTFSTLGGVTVTF